MVNTGSFDKTKTDEPDIINSDDHTFDQQQSRAASALNTTSVIRTETSSHSRELTTSQDFHNREQSSRVDAHKLPVLGSGSLLTKSFATWLRDFEDISRLPPRYGGLGKQINTILVFAETPTFENYYDINGHLHALLAICCKGHAHVIVDRYRSSRDGRGAWLALKKYYQPKLARHLVKLQNDLMSISMPMNGNPETLFDKMEQLNTDISNISPASKQSDEALLTIMCRALKTTGTFDTIIEVVMAHKFDYDIAKERVQAFYEQHQHNNAQAEHVVMLASTATTSRPQMHSL
jgi:hypothetical protein